MFYDRTKIKIVIFFSSLTVHIVWGTKYRYHVLIGDIQIHYRSLLIQIFDAEDVQILKQVIFKNYVYIHLEYMPSQRISDLGKKLKSRSSVKFLQEFPELQKKYWGRHFWGIGYGCWSTGSITYEMVNEYLEHYRRPDGGNAMNFIIEK